MAIYGMGMILLLLPLNAFSQETGSVGMPSPVFTQYNIEGFMTSYSDDISKAGRNQGIGGSPYLLPEFLTGYIYKGENKSIYKIQLNFNAFTNRIELKNQDQYYEIPNYVFDSVLVQNKKLLPVARSINEKVEFMTMEVLDEDSIGNFLLKDHIVKFIDAQEERPYKEAVKAHFKQFPSRYYIYTREQKLIHLDKIKKLSKNQEFPAEVDAYVKNNKINKRNESSLILLFSFLYK